MKDAEPAPLVAVAIDDDRNSQHALKWAADHVLTRGQMFYLLHVRRKIPNIQSPIGQQLSISEVNDGVASAFLEQMDFQTKELLLPFQCFCNRRGLQFKEVILDNTDVPKAIVDFIENQTIDKLILGASSRNALIRFHPAAIGYGGENGSFERSYEARISEKITRDSHAGGCLDFSYQSVASCPSPSRTSIDQSNNYVPKQFCLGGEPQSFTSNASSEYSFHSFHDEQQNTSAHCSNKNSSTYHSSGSGPSKYERSSWILKEESSLSNHSVEDIEAKIRRLKFEPRRMTDMSEDTYKEANYGKADGGLRMEETTLAGEMMPHMAEKEQNSKELLQRNFSDCFHSNIRYRRYTVEEIQKATHNFSDGLKIGEGGYGPVYKCNLDHTVVALKILRSDPTQGMKQFHQEIEVLSCIRHPNMVLLMGACPEYGCLVYEYMANGSLEDRLLCQNGTPPLSWQLRFKIAAEIATGLLFLHQTKPEPLVHRDLKPGNILLDQNFVSKIADVGLARLIPPAADSAVTQYRMTAAAGTFCYIDPEYQTTGLLGVKSDIYALGIILLQLITAHPPMGLAHNVEHALENGTLAELLDPNVPDWPMEETVKFAQLALKCAELRRKDRPDLARVILPELNRLREVAALAEDSFSSHCQPRYVSFRLSR
ncbi:U-box domain-containing protein 52 [Cocos nucifera]|uniref:RING-type E3 ubiquitin transferase n=1 Tax=Cocos nucifera TaxID=13894 RepID=A0A8K0I8U3_COCNU|nr:U-box domain-containing protein 52 [Cocos nucifera]